MLPARFSPGRPMMALAIGAASVLAFTQFAHAQALPEPTEADMRALFDDFAPPATSRAFRPTAAPSSEGLCAGQTAASGQAGGASGGATHRNLVVVPYADDNAPNLNMPIQFELGSDRIVPASAKLLGKLAAILTEADKQGSTFAVAGHTDVSGPDDLNRRLSCARALAVKAYLIGKGVAAARLTAYGFGSSKPLPDAGGPEAHRRVELRRAQ